MRDQSCTGEFARVAVRQVEHQSRVSVFELVDWVVESAKAGQIVLVAEVTRVLIKVTIPNWNLARVLRIKSTETDHQQNGDSKCVSAWHGELGSVTK